MKEILPGIFYWRQAHPKIKIPVSSYFLKPERVLIDPLIPDEGIEWFADDPPQNIYMSIRHHYRHCGEFSERYGCEGWVGEQGLHEFTSGEVVRPFKFGDLLPGNVKAIEIGSICPDEGALRIEKGRQGLIQVLIDEFVDDFLVGPNQTMKHRDRKNIQLGWIKAEDDLRQHLGCDVVARF